MHLNKDLPNALKIFSYFLQSTTYMFRKLDSFLTQKIFELIHNFLESSLIIINESLNFDKSIVKQSPLSKNVDQRDLEAFLQFISSKGESAGSSQMFLNLIKLISKVSMAGLIPGESARILKTENLEVISQRSKGFQFVIYF